MTATKQEGGVRLSYPFGVASQNESLLAAVMNALQWDAAVPHTQIRVEISDGRIVLKGRVNHEYERRAAEMRAVAIAGDAKVVNSIAVAKSAIAAE